MRVVDESMAFYLADLLNALDRGDALPPPGEQHHPVRFQLVHDASGLGTNVGVIYIHGMHHRMVVIAPTDELAETVVSLLRHVDYPMLDDDSTFVPTARPGRIRTVREPLPSQTVVPEKVARPKLGLAGYVLVSVLPLALALGLVATFAWPFLVAVLIVYLLLGAVVWRRSRR